jgi:hypothetical protein
MSRLVSLFGLSIVMIVLISFSARPASAQVWVDMNQLDGKLPDWVDSKYVRPEPAPPRYIRPEPIPLPRPIPPSIDYRKVWVEPVYRIVCRRVWVEPVVRVEYERVWCPPRYEWRETVYWENGEKIVRRERVCVEPGHWDMQRREVVVSPGYWKMIEGRELLSPGYWKLVPC